MLKVLLERLRQGHRTIRFPAAEPVLPERFRGKPVIEPARCPVGCRECTESCPAEAISADPPGLRLDLGRCLFCGECERLCPSGAVRFTPGHRLAATRREELVAGAGADPMVGEAAALVDEKVKRLFGRSLKLRQVSAGGCNACEADVNVLNTVVFDLGRFGIQFVASPRHADGLLITGPVSRNMRLALMKTYEAVPAPKVVIAVGACAISGGIYRDHPEVHNGAAGLLPVDLFIPGCPPHPLTILDGLLSWLGIIENQRPVVAGR